MLNSNSNKTVERLETKMNNQMNQTRLSYGLKPVKTIWCNIYKEKGKHFTWNCDKSICSVCRKTGYLEQFCPKRLTCQWQGPDKHSSRA